MDELINILLVEDDKDDIELLEEAFSDNNIKCRLNVLMQGDKLLPWLNACTELPSVIVLDLNIPKLHGKEVLLLLKAEERFNKIPLIILSTTSVQKEKDFCLANGASEFISKPTTVAGFDEAVAIIMRTAKGQTQGE